MRGWREPVGTKPAAEAVPVKEEDFSTSDRLLLSEVAQRLAPQLAEITRAWTAAIPLTAPADRLPAMRNTLAGLAAELLDGFFRALSAGDPPHALAALDEFCERLIRGRLHDRAGNRRLTLEQLVRAARLLREIVDHRISRAFGAEGEREISARLAFARFSNFVSDSLALTYSRLYEQRAADHERELRAARDAALEASRLKSAFLANMAHEIRTPLNVILGYADLMVERVTEVAGENGAEYGEPIQRAGQRLLDTVGAVLDLSRIESGAFELKPAVITLASIVERHVADLRILARKKGIGLTCRIEEPEAQVVFDEHCLSNTIINLLQNAIKFTEQGAVTVRVFRNRAGVLSLEVRDTGRGIASAYLPHLFDPFSREGNPLLPQREGAGLGLALVKRYVEFNRAQISVESTLEAGTAFTVSFFGEPAATTAA